MLINEKQKYILKLSQFEWCSTSLGGKDVETKTRLFNDSQGLNTWYFKPWNTNQSWDTKQNSSWNSVELTSNYIQHQKTDAAATVGHRLIAGVLLVGNPWWSHPFLLNIIHITSHWIWSQPTCPLPWREPKITAPKMHFSSLTVQYAPWNHRHLGQLGGGAAAADKPRKKSGKFPLSSWWL